MRVRVLSKPQKREMMNGLLLCNEKMLLTEGRRATIRQARGQGRKEPGSFANAIKQDVPEIKGLNRLTANQQEFWYRKKGVKSWLRIDELESN